MCSGNIAGRIPQGALSALCPCFSFRLKLHPPRGSKKSPVHHPSEERFPNMHLLPHFPPHILQPSACRKCPAFCPMSHRLCSAVFLCVSKGEIQGSPFCLHHACLTSPFRRALKVMAGNFRFSACVKTRGFSIG